MYRPYDMDHTIWSILYGAGENVLKKSYFIESKAPLYIQLNRYPFA